MAQGVNWQQWSPIYLFALHAARGLELFRSLLARFRQSKRVQFLRRAFKSSSSFAWTARVSRRSARCMNRVREATQPRPKADIAIRPEIRPPSGQPGVWVQAQVAERHQLGACPAPAAQ